MVQNSKENNFLNDKKRKNVFLNLINNKNLQYTSKKYITGLKVSYIYVYL